jgi:hypothetical protein
MSSTSTKFLNFEKLQSQGQSAVTVIKLMMVCNDLSLADEALSRWQKEKTKMMKQRRIGAMMYFARIQLSHLHEGFKIIESIRNDKTLKSILERCDSRTQESFRKLENFLPGGSEEKTFERLIGRLRHNLTFHYDESGKLTQKAIEDRASRPEARISSITRGTTPGLWHFKAADELIDSVVVRQIWNIPRDRNLRIEADNILGRVWQIGLDFIDFAGEFIWKYCDDVRA